MEVAADEQIPEGMAGEELIPAETSTPSSEHSAEETAGDSGLAAHSPEVQQPAWGERGPAPGYRGCWALNKRGEPCAAARRRDSDYCTAHAGLGVAADPKKHAQVGTRRSAEVRRRRADLRVIVGSTRLDTPRGALRALAVVEAERLAGSAINAALDPDIDPLKRGQHALAVIEAADPRNQASLSVSTDLDPSELGLSELMTLAAQNGLVPDPSE